MSHHSSPISPALCYDCRAPLSGLEHVADTCDECRLFYATREGDRIGPTKAELRVAYFARIEANREAIR